MSFDEMFSTLNISASGLAAERRRMDVIAHNLANANTTRESTDADGKAVPYCRRVVIFRAVLDDQFSADGRLGLGGVRVEDSVKDVPGEFATKELPGHPDADAKGFVRMPNVSPITEMIDLITAQRAYQASLTSIRNFKEMMQQTLRLGR